MSKGGEDDLLSSFFNDIKEIAEDDDGSEILKHQIVDGDGDNPRKKMRPTLAEPKVIARASHSSAKEDEANFLKELKNGLDEDLSLIFSKKKTETMSLFVSQGSAGDSVVPLVTIGSVPALIMHPLSSTSIAPIRPPLSSNSSSSKKNIRMSGDEIWEDPTLSDWPDSKSYI